MAPLGEGSENQDVTVEMTTAAFDFSQYFNWQVIGPVPLESAIKRVVAFCTEPKSGWGAYDLAASATSGTGVFDMVTPWTLLLANALNGQVTLGNVADFTLTRREEFAELLAAVPVDVDLARMDSVMLGRVIDACCFGFPGVWGPKITKVGALYRPRAIPVLDGYVAMAFGFSSEGFSAAASERGLDRKSRISLVVEALARAVRDQDGPISLLREAVQPVVPEMTTLSDLRLMDIVVWTSQDDRMERRGKELDRWVKGVQGSHTPTSDFVPVPLTRFSGESHDSQEA